MIYWKYIDIRNKEIIIEKTLAYIKKHQHNNIGLYKLDWVNFYLYCPEILSCMNDYGVQTIWAATYIIETDYQSKIHIDYLDVNFPRYRLNIPILNCENSITEFYTGGLFVPQEQKDDSTYKEVHPQFKHYCVKQTELELVKPALISVQTPHRVKIISTKVPRISLSVYLNKDPVDFLYN